MEQTRQAYIAASGGIIGWTLTLSVTEAAQIFAATATGAWMITQAVLAVLKYRRPK